jgi:hypothetical protein
MREAIPRSKPKMQAVGACLRKLVMLFYGLLKNRAPFDPAWSSRITLDNTLPRSAPYGAGVRVSGSTAAAAARPGHFVRGLRISPSTSGLVDTRSSSR